jgi:hypothetical protein
MMTVKRFKKIPVLMVPLSIKDTSSNQLLSIKETLALHLDYEPKCSIHTIPSGSTHCRVELKSHEDTALLEFFNVLGGSYIL